MDTSETYTKMCEKAEEIQALRREKHNLETGKWKPGDFWFHIFDKCAHIVDEYRDAWSDIPLYIHHPIECFWLPRQDQLQEMITRDVCWSICDLTARFYDFLKSLEPLIPFSSMEQLWLAFVMKERYNKTWDSDSWK